MLKWECPTAEQWERYLLAQDTPDQKDLEQHLESCPHCRFTLTQLSQEFESLEVRWDETATQDTIRLTPMMVKGHRENRISIRLAAQGRQKGAEENAITLSSEDQRVLLRVVKDAHTEETWLYVLAEDPETCRNVLVRLPSQDREFITDAEGRVNLGTVDWFDKEPLTVEVKPAHVTFTVNPFDVAGAGESVELKSPKGDHVKMALTGEGHSYRLDIQVIKLSNTLNTATLKVAIRAAGPDRLVQIQPMVSERVSFDGVDAGQKFEVYLYR